ncbi:unnamed protein product, partial [Dibothriocephalus latus]
MGWTGYPYCRLQTVTVTNRVVTLNLLEDDGSVKARPFQLTCIRAANSLYRSITEVHSKDYAFDVRLTCREVYDRA